MIVQNALIPDPVKVTPEDTVDALVALLLAQEQEVAAVVASDDQLLGVVGLHDVMAATVPLAVSMKQNLRSLLHEGYFDEHFQAVMDRKVARIMRLEVDGLLPADPLIAAVALFVQQRRRALPVTDEEGRFLGMVTRPSLLRRIGEARDGAAST